MGHPLRYHPISCTRLWYHIKCDFNKATNMHSRGPTEQHFYVWEPHHGYLHKLKKVSWCPLIKEGHLSHKYAIASPVEPMNLLSKGPNESLPNIDPSYGKMSWYLHVLYYYPYHRSWRYLALKCPFPCSEITAAKNSTKRFMHW